MVQCENGVEMILAGDIGGTNTRLALFEKGLMIGTERKFPSHNYLNLEEILEEFLGTRRVDKACFGVAGPVRDGKCRATNLAWVIDAAHISRSLQIESVHLLNDLEANAWGLKGLKDEELFLLHKGQAQKGNRALIAAGTGLGEAGLFWDGKKYHPFACEGGHVDFAPRDEIEVELLFYLQKKFGHVSYERVISGPGLLSIFEFLIETGRESLSQEVKVGMERRDPSRVISESRDPACNRAVDWFLSIYGAEAGNMALKFLSLGGFFVGGGIAPHLIDRFKTGGFHAAFVDKGRFKELLESIPIWIVLNDNAALIGAAIYAERVK